jgi:hypothetical protein
VLFVLSLRPLTAKNAKLSRHVIALDHDPLDLIEAELVASTIVELRRARGGVVRHRRGLFECTALLELGRDASCPETVTVIPSAPPIRAKE